MIHDTIKQRLRASLLLSPPPKSARASALLHAANIQEDGTWNDLRGPASWPGSGRPVQLERTLLLAKAHRAAAGALDEPLRRALDFWLSRDFTSPIWRDNQIVIPRLVGEIALLYDNGLSAGAAGKVTEILARSRWSDWVDPTGWVDHSGTELLGVAYNHLLRGCLENASSFFETAFARIFREIRQVKPGEEGIQADMTFHSSQSDQAGGGFAFVRECAQFIALAHGTPWQAPVETVKLFVGFVLDGQQWMVRQGTVDTQAPNDVFSEVADRDGLAAVIQQLAQLGNPPRRLELAAFAHRLYGHGEALSGHRHFWRARMSVHQRPGFYASLRLSAPPPVADGQSYLLRSGHEYHRLTMSAAPHLSPGTTNFLHWEGPAGEIGSRPDAYPARWFSGGVSEGDGGLAVTELKRPGLSGKKAWFFFDESLVCLGTALHSTLADRPVGTTINRCRLEGPVVARFLNGDQRLLTPGLEHPLTTLRALEHDGISYVFPGGAGVTVRFDDPVVDQPSGSATVPTFRLQLDHGPRPQGASWTYIVLPTGDEPGVAGRVVEEVRRIEILANSPALQAVRHAGLGLLGVAFWEPGVMRLPGGGRVAANHSCLLLCREGPGGGTRLSIANPTSEPATVHVEYGGQCVCFELPGGPDAGRGLSRLL